jgi:hypothetical protein
LVHVTPDLKKDLPAAEKKEMLSVIHHEDLIEVRINYSSLDIVQTCLRKAYFALNRSVRSATEAPALVSGKGVHRAMEVWYCAEKEHRRIGSPECDDMQSLLLANVEPTDELNQQFIGHGKCARCASIFAYLEEGKKLIGIDGPRNPESVINILNNYFDNYLDDPYELVVDADGPVCERSFEMVIFEGELLGKKTRIVFFGTIDSVLRNRETGEILGCDHKTSHSLGKDFLNRIRPNFQYTGYYWAIRDILKLPIDRFMVNGIQIAKTRSELVRQYSHVTDEDIEELRYSLIWNVKKYLECLAAANNEFFHTSQAFPMSAPNACSMWGGCNFKRICELPRSMHDSMLSAEFPEAEV